MKKFFVVALCLIILLSTTCFAADFSDLASEHWAYKNVMNLVDKGIVSGYPDGTYRPDKTITRGEFFKLVTTALIVNEEIEMAKELFEGEHWAMPYVFCMQNENSIMDGAPYEGLDNPITRREMAIVLGKATIGRNITSPKYDENGNIIITEFTDIDNIANNEKLYIQQVANIGLIKGYTDGSFKANNNMTRAEVATVIYRLYNELEVNNK